MNETSRDYLRKRQTPALIAIKEAVSQSGLGDVLSEVLQISTEFEANLDHIERFEDSEEYTQANPTHVSAVPLIIKTAYRTMGLHHFYTANASLVKCYGIKEGTTIKDASALVDVNIYRYVSHEEEGNFTTSSYQLCRALSLYTLNNPLETRIFAVTYCFLFHYDHSVIFLETLFEAMYAPLTTTLHTKETKFSCYWRESGSPK